MPLSYPLASPPLSFLEKAGWPLNLLRFKKEDFCLTFCKYLSSHGQKNGKDVTVNLVQIEITIQKKSFFIKANVFV